MEITGIIRNIKEPEQAGQNEKQTFTLESGGVQQEYLLFNRSHLITPFKIGDDVKLLYNSKPFQNRVTNYVNSIQLLPTYTKQKAEPKPEEKTDTICIRLRFINKQKKSR